MSGYSGTPLPRKLGIKPGHRVLMINSPSGLGIDDHEGPEPYDVILLFCPDMATLLDEFPGAAGRLARDGGLWVCWPKKSSGVATDLSGGPVREYGLERGLVDNKVCAVDETWSGLRFVYRLVDR
ncbi:MULTISPECIES: hypothetical protein [Microtetraspora]|uniref:DUF3052 domain-containing protein n=1 Tax=Microtetraspora glauca TaxID=1996 RepID=A0ABV3GQZ6_MICGL|nr:hypothetical protein [Microtetraspora sp. AC03309]MCC5578043.1 DUF3052 family protein [Microtetraspora sp. AC03309]